MLTPGELRATDDALSRFRARLDAADAEAGGAWQRVKDWTFDAFSFGWTGSGSAPREDVRRGATSRALYDVLRAKRGELVEAKPGDRDELDDGWRHEEAAMVVEVANRAAGWDRATTLAQMRADTDVPTEVGKAARAVVDAAAGAPWGKLLTVGVVLVALVVLMPLLTAAVTAGLARRAAGR